MANLAASAVTVLETWLEGGVSNKRTTCVKVQLVLTGQGTSTNKILATLFGMTKIDSSTPFAADGDDHIYVSSPSYDGSYLQLKASATDALADITDTVRGIIRGT